MHGRDPVYGLDCVGLAAQALRRQAPSSYALRGSDPRRVRMSLAAAGLTAIEPAEARAGDLLLVDAGPAQLHLIVLTGGGFVHAHAGLRRIVETPGLSPWPVASAWRLQREG